MNSALRMGGKFWQRLQTTSAGPFLMLGVKDGFTLQATSVGPLLLLGEKGGDRLALAVTKTGPTVGLTDTSGKLRAVLALESGEPELSFLDARGSETARLGQYEHGSGLTLFREGKSMGYFLLDDSGRPQFALSDQSGDPVLIAGVRTDLPVLELDDHDRRAVSLSVTNSGTGFKLYHANGQVGVAIGLQSGAPIFGILDDHGKSLFTAP